MAHDFKGAGGSVVYCREVREGLPSSHELIVDASTANGTMHLLTTPGEEASKSFQYLQTVSVIQRRWTP